MKHFTWVKPKWFLLITWVSLQHLIASYTPLLKLIAGHTHV